MKILNKLLAFVLTFTLILTSTNFVFAKFDYSSATEAGNDWGTAYGYVLGHQDYINDEESDYLSRYIEIEKTIKSDFNIDVGEVTPTFRSDFTTAFKTSFKTGYLNGYELYLPNDTDTKLTSTEQGEIWGTYYGMYDGRINKLKGGTLTANNKKYDLLERLLMDPSLDFGALKAESEAFDSAFSSAYLLEYVDAISYKSSEASEGGTEGSEGEVVIEETVTTFDIVTTFAMTNGYALGSATAINDFSAGKNNESTTAYLDYNSNHNIIEESGLGKYVSQEISKTDLQNAFRDGFYEGYDSSYLTQLSNSLTKNLNKLEVGPSGVNFTISGSPKASVDKSTVKEEVYATMDISVPANSAYGYQYLNVYEVPTTFRLEDRYTPLGTVFYVGGYSDYNGINKESISLLNDWTISFPFTGSYRAGIYKKVGSKWIYQSTVGDGSTLTMTIPKGEYSEGQYTVLIDDAFVELSDIYSSWASESLEVFMRRNLLAYNTKTQRYYPEESITRGEFSNLLKNYLVDNGYPETSKAMNFTDVSTESQYYSGVRYVYSNGYIKGVSDTKFDLTSNLTYKQFEVILSRILNENVSLSKYFEEMRNENFYMSKGEKNMNSPISKSEVVYILYSIWK
ncbi:MAG: S-layer homology domain-containing protein [Lachnospirales bacterium]